MPGNWDESKHPRRDDGKFGTGQGSAKGDEGGTYEESQRRRAAAERRTRRKAREGSDLHRGAAAQMKKQREARELVADGLAKKDAKNAPPNAGLKWSGNAQDHINAIVDAKTPREGNRAWKAAAKAVLNDDSLHPGNRQTLLRKLSELRDKHHGKGAGRSGAQGMARDRRLPDDEDERYEILNKAGWYFHDTPEIVRTAMRKHDRWQSINEHGEHTLNPSPKQSERLRKAMRGAEQAYMDAGGGTKGGLAVEAYMKRVLGPGGALARRPRSAVPKDRQMQFSVWHEAMRQIHFDADPTDPLPGNFKVSNPRPGVWVVHDVPIFYETLRDGDHYDRSWMHRAFENARTAQREGHLAPVHVHHRFRADVKSFAAGAMRPVSLRTVQYKGRPTLCAHYDLVVTNEHVAREIAAGRLLWRSPEVSFDEARIVSLALLDHEAPFFEGPMTTVKNPEALAASRNPASLFAWEATDRSPVVAFSVSNGLTRMLIRAPEGRHMTYPIKTSAADPKDEESKVKQMADGGRDAPGGSAAPGKGEDAPGGSDQQKPPGQVNEKAAQTKGVPTQMADDDREDDDEEDEAPDDDFGGDEELDDAGDDLDLGDEDLDGLGDAGLGDDAALGPQRPPMTGAGQVVQNGLLDAIRTTPATLEQSLEALGFLQQLITKMKGASGQQQLPQPQEGPSDQMSQKQLKQFQADLAEAKGELAGLKKAAAEREQSEKIKAFADEAVASFRGTVAGQDPNLHAELTAFAREHGLEAAQRYVKGLRRSSPRVLTPFADPARAFSADADDVPADLKPFVNDGTQAYEQARKLYPQWEELRARGFCRDIDFRTFVDRERAAEAQTRFPRAAAR